MGWIRLGSLARVITFSHLDEKLEEEVHNVSMSEVTNVKR